MAELIEYARTLADEIGPRPATTDAEHRAAEWLATTFGSHGLQTELQEFDAPRTYAWAYVIYHTLTLASAFAAGFRPYLTWPAFAVSAIVAFFLWSDLDTRWGLTRLMPKGPSQNVIARHVPRARRGERLRRIVVVAHYDSARASLAFAPSMVGGFATTFALMKWTTLLTPVFVLLMALPFAFLESLDPWLWYATMAVAAYLVVPLLINVHRELFMPFVPGANDNASGVAAMLGVMERLVPAPDATSLVTTGSFPQVRRGVSAALEADVVPEGALLEYTPAGPPESGLPDDFTWAEPVPEPVAEARKEQGVLDFDTIEFGAVSDEDVRRARRAASQTPAEPTPADAESRSRDAGRGRPAEEAQGRGLLGRLGRKRSQREDEVSEWLGVDDEFDARKAGREIGSWDNFENGDDDDDGFGWKGGWAGDDPIGDPEFAANEAARIRYRVTETIDRELTEKEIWFVATGSEEVGTFGMQTLLRDCHEDLKDALIINIDGCGAGQLHWASGEGMARRYRASQRLVGLARRVSRETETVIKPRVFRGLSTDASPALARGFKALSIMALDASGMPVNWHWRTDSTEALDAGLIEKTADFVAEMVRQA
jgi:hypothetical protein